MVEMKYVVVDSDEEGEQLFIFPKEINHSDFAEVLSYIKTYPPGEFRNWRRLYREPISAGFTNGESCYGRSESLDLNSRPEDNALLKDMK